MRKKKSKFPSSGSGSKLPAPCIVPGLLYLGPVSAASNHAFLQREAITHIISVGKSPSSPPIEGIIYERLSLSDEETSTIGPVATRACEIIDSAAASGGRVLIHCSAGISRSPTMVSAYLMKGRGMTLRGSLETLVKARSVVAPNPGFLRQLSEMEKELFAGQMSFDPAAITAKCRLASCL
jgi:atypical dual specificity phosphatase